MLGRRLAYCLLAALSAETLAVESASAANAGPADGTGAGGAKWSSPVIRVGVDASVMDVDTVALDSLVDSISAWQRSAPHLPTIVVERSEKPCLVGYEPGGANRNCVLFEKHGATIAKGALAITVITFDQSSGQILDADIVINGEHNFGAAESMSPKQSESTYDLQNVLTHEFGHFLGLGEEYAEKHATMFAYSLPGETEKRDLDASDEHAIGKLYAEDLTTDTPTTGCAASVAGRAVGRRMMGTQGTVSLVFGLAGVALVSRRRRSLTMGLPLAALLLASSDLHVGPAVTSERVVTSVTSHWEGGLIVSAMELGSPGCANCRAEQVSVLGGTVAGISQQFGLLRPLQVGDRIEVRQSSSIHPGSVELRHGRQELQLIEE